MKTSIVLGTCYGDEGKGKVTALLSKKNDLVIRFSGGHNAGHMVFKDKVKHIFSSFGSGALNGADTYISEYCTFYPNAFINELKVLNSLGIKPIFYLNPLTPVTTIFDVFMNQLISKDTEHGTVGVGFGTTIKRHTETPIKLFAHELFYDDILEHKLELIRSHYISDFSLSEEMEIIQEARKFIKIATLQEIKNNYTNIIFEGSQGIMLDMDFGFFPNVTRSNTTSKNAMNIIKENGLPSPNIYYVMRSYLTRHGNGYMPNECYIHLINNEHETNVYNKWQGNFRYGKHSLTLLNHALNCDKIYSGNSFKNIVVNCLDQTNNKIYVDNETYSTDSFSKLFHKQLINKFLYYDFV